MIYNRARLSNLSRCRVSRTPKIRSLSIHFYRARSQRKLRKDEIEGTVANCNHCALRWIKREGDNEISRSRSIYLSWKIAVILVHAAPDRFAPRTFAHGRRQGSVKTTSKTRRKRGCKPLRKRSPRFFGVGERTGGKERIDLAITRPVRKVETSIKIKLSSDGMVFARPSFGRCFLTHEISPWHSRSNWKSFPGSKAQTLRVRISGAQGCNISNPLHKVSIVKQWLLNRSFILCLKISAEANFRKSRMLMILLKS